MADKNGKKLKKEIDEMITKLGYFQRVLKNYKVPIMIVFEGVHASGKGMLANEVLMALDARYTKFYATHAPTADELRKPFLWQYAINTPSSKEIYVYYRSWYSLYIAMKNKTVKNSKYKDPEILVKEMENFETVLRNSGVELIKLYIEIDKDKQMEHIKKMYDNPRTMWKAQEYDKDNDDDYQKSMEEMVKKDEKSWKTIKMKDDDESIHEVFSHLVKTLEERVEKEKEKEASRPIKRDGFFNGDYPNILEDFEESEDISKDLYKEKIEMLQNELREIQYTLYERKIPLILVYEGWDAAGKGGNIRRVVKRLDPTGYDIETTAAPTEVELNHHYLWRFWTDLPRSGHIGIRDRSWYGRVMVERVEGFANNEEIKRAYDEINGFEEALTNFGAIVIKFFIHISKEEQLDRFKARQEDENKVWKITDEDWRNRDKWSLYEEAINDMLNKTSKENAPWHIINGNSKRYARVKALEIIIETCYKTLFTENQNTDK
ncbi:MAG: phosphate--AMP phosphotransferase [Clostridium sp.]|nr:phosphate--AMP phosphotransferase [Clostridium sp.]